MRQLFCGRAQSRERHHPAFVIMIGPARLALAFRSHTPCAFYPAKSMPSAAAMRKPFAPSTKRDRFRIPSAPSNTRSRLRIFNNKGMIADIDCAHEPNPSIIPQELHGGCTGAAREPNVSSP